MADKRETDADHESSHEVSSLKATRTIDPGAEPDGPRRMVPPEIIGNMTPEHRAAVEKRLKRKIDLRLLPSLIIMYILNYIDRCVCPVQPCWRERRGGSPRSFRNNIAAAALAGLKDDLDLTGSQFPVSQTSP